jgi:hypothetical protein
MVPQAYSSVNVRDILHPQESFNLGSTNVRLVILASDRGAIEFSGNIQFLSGSYDIVLHHGTLLLSLQELVP